MIQELTPNNFKELVTDNDQPIVIDFWADWCPPCKMLKPHFKKSSEDNPDITFLTVDTETHQDLAKEFGVRSLPTLSFVKNNEEVNRVVGFKDQNTLNNLISETFK